VNVIDLLTLLNILQKILILTEKTKTYEPLDLKVVFSPEGSNLVSVPHAQKTSYTLAYRPPVTNL